MRLRRIDAVKYGGLADGAVDGLGDGLTVVLGPNEAGKSTFTALVRHVLYGFPKKSAKEPSFAPPSGARHGRLVLADGDGEWAVERTEGPHGGPVVVRALSGGERPGLLADLVRGVSESAYRVVFGFGLADLAAIEEMRDAGDDIVGRLYAAGTGAVANPVEVRAGLAAAAGEIWASGASRRRLNVLLDERDSVLGGLRDLAAEADGFAGDRTRLEELERRAADARETRDRLETASREVNTAAELVERLQGEAEEAEGQQAQLAAEIEGDEAELARLAPDEQVLAAGVVIDELMAGLSAHVERTERLAADEGLLSGMDRQIASETAAIGGAAGRDVVGPTPEQITAADEWRVRLDKAESRADESRRSARDAQSAARAAGGAVAGPAKAVHLAAYAMIVLGAAVLFEGVRIAQWTVWATGLVITLAGVAFRFFRLPLGASVPEDTSQLTGIAGNVARRAEGDAAELEKARAEWAEWLAGAGLPGDLSPAQASALLSSRRELAKLVAERACKADAVSIEAGKASAYAARLAEAAGAFLPEAAACTRDTAESAARRAAEALEAAREAARAREAVEARVIDARRSADEFGRRATAARVTIADVLATHESDGIAALQVKADTTDEDATGASEEYEALVAQRGELKGRLEAGSRGSGMSELRAEQTGLEERIASSLSDYAVLATAERLMARAQDEWERNRQPQVVTAAGDVFRRITGDRFARINVPMGGRSIQVISERGTEYETGKLSRGTAEALYLSMRIGLIEQLGEVGCSLPVLMDDILVNLDPQRREGAAGAIAHLASQRQVVYFTCHPETVAVLTAADPRRTLVEIGRCPAL